MLADIMHCPGKKGIDVSGVIEKQLARVGLNVYDVVASTGDGGGENEGHQGIHSHFENLSSGYVRHRCLPHIAWRTADMAIRASGLDYRSLAAYLVDGVSWSRLRAIATTAEAERGPQPFYRWLTGLQEPLRSQPLSHCAKQARNRPQLPQAFAGQGAPLAQVGDEGPRAADDFGC